jgi:hypothetical protein
MVALLLSRKADISLTDHTGRNCLDMAVDYGNKYVIYMFRINIAFMMLICQPKLRIDIAPCSVLPANRSVVGILNNNG